MLTKNSMEDAKIN